MRNLFVVFFAAIGVCLGQGVGEQVRRLEARGERGEARELLQRAVTSNPDAATLTAWAEFLDRSGDPEARKAYEKLASVERDSAKKAAALRRLVMLDLLAYDQQAATRDLAAYRQAGGS